MNPTSYHNKIRKDTIIFGSLCLCILVTIGTVFFHLVEGNGWFNSLYFVVMTLSTVGYGDIVPHTMIGKIITMVYALTGVPFFIFIGGFIIEQRMGSLVKSYVRNHHEQMIKIETELDLVNDSVDSITENVEELHENIEEISESVDEITEDVDAINENVEEITDNVDAINEQK